MASRQLEQRNVGLNLCMTSACAYASGWGLLVGTKNGVKPAITHKGATGESQGVDR